MTNEKDRHELIWQYLSRLECHISDFLSSLEELYSNEPLLLSQTGQERCLSLHLASYLKTSFPDYNVDPEYTKCLGETKEITHKTNQPERPDILIHQQNTHEKNLFAIEVKHDSKPLPKDYAKLKNLTLQDGKYHYKIGFLVNLKEKFVAIEIFINGELITKEPINWKPRNVIKEQIG